MLHLQMLLTSKIPSSSFNLTLSHGSDLPVPHVRYVVHLSVILITAAHLIYYQRLCTNILRCLHPTQIPIFWYDVSVVPRFHPCMCHSSAPLDSFNFSFCNPGFYRLRTCSHMAEQLEPELAQTRTV